MTWHNYFIEDGVSRLCRLAQRKDITVKLVPVPERHASVTDDTSNSDVSEREDSLEYRGFIVVELWDPPTTEIPNCWVGNPAKPLVAIDQAIGYLLYKESVDMSKMTQPLGGPVFCKEDHEHDPDDCEATLTLTCREWTYLASAAKYGIEYFEDRAKRSNAICEDKYKAPEQIAIAREDAEKCERRISVTRLARTKIHSLLGI